MKFHMILLPVLLALITLCSTDKENIEVKHSLTYIAGYGGTVSGMLNQVIQNGQNGFPVVAVPDQGSVFTGWSDGVCEAERQELHVTGDFEVTANFVREIWSDNFDDELSLNEKYSSVSTNGMSVNSDDFLTGTSSLRQIYQEGQVDAGWIIKKIDGDYPEHIFVRWYHKFEAGFQGIPQKMARFRYRKPDWTSPLSIYCWLEVDDPHRATVEVRALNSSKRNSAGWLGVYRTDFSYSEPANIGRWVCFEIEIRLNTPGLHDGLYRIWIDDVLKAENLNLDLRGSETYRINEVMLDCYWNAGSPRIQSRYYDAFVISTGKIGPLDTDDQR
jgi:hypothetical protein